MSKRPSARTTSVLGVVSALGLGGCENEDPCEGLRTFDPPPEPQPSATAPPTVLAGEWIGAGVLELQFSEPLAVGTTPDPNRFAILGWSAVVQTYDPYSGPDTCYVRTRYAALGVGYYGATPTADVWIAPEDPSVLRLRLSNAGASCRTIPDSVADGVMLVYVNGGDAGEQLLDAEGDPIADVGPAWAISALESCIGSVGYYYSYCSYSLNQSSTGHLPAITTLAQIPCPS